MKLCQIYISNNYGKKILQVKKHSTDMLRSHIPGSAVMGFPSLAV